MKLPNGDKAVVDIRKLTAYALNASHSKGGHKACVFRAVLGLTEADGEILRKALLVAAAECDAGYRGSVSFGEQYEILFSMRGPNGNSAEVTSGWQIDFDKDYPRLVSCYIER